MTFTLPEWSLWALGTIIVLAIASRFKGSGGMFDFAPLFGCAIIFGWALLALGVALGRSCR